MMKEVDAFGKPSNWSIVTPRLLIWTLPTVDSKVATAFMSYALKWLDTTYWDAYNKAKNDFENITFES